MATSKFLPTLFLVASFLFGFNANSQISYSSPGSNYTQSFSVDILEAIVQLDKDPKAARQRYIEHLTRESSLVARRAPQPPQLATTCCAGFVTAAHQARPTSASTRSLSPRLHLSYASRKYTACSPAVQQVQNAATTQCEAVRMVPHQFEANHKQVAAS